MRIYIALIFMLSVIWPVGSSGQELIWQGSLEDGAVNVTKNTISQGYYSGISDSGFPIKFVEWKDGYLNHYFLLQDKGEVEPFSISGGRHAVSISDPANGWLYLGNSNLTTGSPKQGVVWLQNEPYMNQGWPIGNNRYVLITKTKTCLFNSKSGEMKLLDPNLSLGWPVGSSTGLVAARGQMERDREVLRVFEQDGRLIFERTDESPEKEIRFLAIDNAGTFIEFSLCEKKNRDMVLDHRVRVFFGTETEIPIQIPLSGGHLKWQSNNIAVWGKGLVTLIVRLDDQNIWQPVEEFSGSAYNFIALDDGGFVLALNENEGGVSLSFYDANGKAVSGPYFLKNVVEMTLHDGKILVVNSFKQTSLFKMIN